MWAPSAPLRYLLYRVDTPGLPRRPRGIPRILTGVACVDLPPQRSARLLPQDEEEDAREGEATRPCLPAETQHTQLCV